MPLLPKSKYRIKQTGGNAFRDVNGQPYQGFYIELNNGTFFKGEDTREISPTIQLFSNEIQDIGEIKNTNSVYNSSVYSKLNPQLTKELDNMHPITNTKTVPEDEDYKKNEFTRYFCKRINNNIYYEINRTTYFELLDGNKTYDSLLYKTGKIDWSLSLNSETENAITLEIMENTKGFYGLSTLFPNLIEFQIRPEETNFSTPSLPQIEGREYIDGTPIPSNLPSSYALPAANPNIIGQKCFTCKFWKLPPNSTKRHWGVPKDRKEKEYICTKWVAEVKKDYWCKSWKADKEDYKKTRFDFIYSDIKLHGRNQGQSTKYNIHFSYKKTRPSKHWVKAGQYVKISNATTISGIYKIISIWYDSKGNIGALQIPANVLSSKLKKLPPPKHAVMISGVIEPVSKQTNKIGKKIYSKQYALKTSPKSQSPSYRGNSSTAKSAGRLGY